MSTSSVGRDPIMNDTEIIEFMRNDEQPVLTAKEIAAEFDVTNAAVNKRLNALVDEGRVVKKQVGSSAVVWWPHPESAAATRSSPESVSQ